MDCSAIQSFQKDVYVKEKKRGQQDSTANICVNNRCIKSWGDNVDEWRRWWKKFEGGGAFTISKELIKSSNIKRGHRVLDVATGYGEPAISAAEYVGLSGSILGIDISTNILELAKERAKEKGLRNIEFRGEDIENITLPQQNFDAVLCRWGLMHFKDLDGALKNIYNSLVSGGIFTAATWGKPYEVPMLSIPISKALEITGQSLRYMGNLSCIGPFSLSDPVMLRQSFEKAGFRDVTVRELTATIEVNSIQDYIRSVRRLNTTIQSIESNLPAKRQELIWRNVAKEIVKRGLILKPTQTDYNKSSNRLRVKFENKTICITGSKC
jgi:enediyne biosynthesis protein CalE5